MWTRMDFVALKLAGRECRNVYGTKIEIFGVETIKLRVFSLLLRHDFEWYTHWMWPMLLLIAIIWSEASASMCAYINDISFPVCFSVLFFTCLHCRARIPEPISDNIMKCSINPKIRTLTWSIVLISKKDSSFDLYNAKHCKIEMGAKFIFIMLA